MEIEDFSLEDTIYVKHAYESTIDSKSFNLYNIR